MQLAAAWKTPQHFSLYSRGTTAEIFQQAKCRVTEVMAKIGFLSVISFVTFLPLSLSVKTSQWSAVTKLDVSSYEAMTSARSTIECVTGCTAYSHCISSAYDPKTGLCYLHPNTSHASESPSGLLVYKQKGEI